MARPAKIVPPSTREKKKVKQLGFSRGPKLPPRPPGPPYVDLPAAHPGRVSKCLLYELSTKPFPVWAAINTRGRFKMGAYARWRWRRGALFIYWKMFAVEMKRRAAVGLNYFDGRPLYINNFDQYKAIDARSGDKYINSVIAPPGNAFAHSVLSHKGQLTKRGFESLEDKEFVWPFLDAACPSCQMFTELQAGQEYELMWSDHFYGQNAQAPALEVGGHTESTYALVYARYLKEYDRAGPGTKLGRWLDSWLERSEAEEDRLARLK